MKDLVWFILALYHILPLNLIYTVMEVTLWIVLVSTIALPGTYAKGSIKCAQPILRYLILNLMLFFALDVSYWVVILKQSTAYYIVIWRKSAMNTNYCQVSIYRSWHHIGWWYLNNRERTTVEGIFYQHKLLPGLHIPLLTSYWVVKLKQSIKYCKGENLLSLCIHLMW